MKNNKTTEKPFSMQVSEWERQTPSLSRDITSSSRNPSLRVAIKGRVAERPFPYGRLSVEEEHRTRLVRLGEKVGRLAHDIRNPLSSIEWFATLLGRDHYSPEERQGLVEQCIQAVRTLDHLVSNMLVFSSPVKEEQTSIQIKSLLDEVELLAIYHLQKKRLKVHRQDDERLAEMKGHETLVKQCLLNLLMNAIQASSPDSPIEIHCRQEKWHRHEFEEPGIKQGIVIRMRDYGCGMSEEDQAQVFRPFFSLRKGGTGLGLSIVNQIMYMHHGLIEVSSQKGIGTAVELFFPQ